ncbi:hypothetical protein ISS37_00875 [candidate division KSB1 bacterium]|nr:hypothetical protein [candidate division KSB1 bacterium]
MTQKSNTLWGLLVVLAFVLLGWVGFRTLNMNRQVKVFLRARAEATLETDEELVNTVTRLETELKNRKSFVFRLGSDPLKLTRVIKSKAFLTRMGVTDIEELSGELRLSATVIGPGPSAAAVIKTGFKSHVVKVGDVIDGNEVIAIEKKKVTIRNRTNGKKRVLRPPKG